jgi:hypothetical protein
MSTPLRPHEGGQEDRHPLERAVEEMELLGVLRFDADGRLLSCNGAMGRGPARRSQAAFGPRKVAGRARRRTWPWQVNESS